MRFGKALLTVLLPFAAGYFLSYLLRTVNAVAAASLVEAFGLDAAALGLLTAAYFLAFAAMQLPLGVALDRVGPLRVQLVLLPVMGAGAVVFALAEGMAGLKAIAQWVPPERLALANGLLVAIGGLGAVAATMPAEALLDALGWRGMFGLCGAGALAATLALALLAPRDPPRVLRGSGRPPGLFDGLAEIACDPGFRRLAPLSACCIGTAFALHGLWAAPWLADVAEQPRPLVVRTLTEMALALVAGALGLGLVADRLRRVGVRPASLLAWVAGMAVALQAALVLGGHAIAPAAPMLWIVLAAVGSATVLSYAALAEVFPRQLTGRANAMMNLLHIGTAFGVQAGIGAVVALWPTDPLGRYPAEAYAAALGINLVPQALALLWFVWTRRPQGLPAAAAS